jgi:FAD/FMN-containing dehydrogenase
MIRLPGFRGALLRTEEERVAFSTASGILSELPRAVAVPEDADDAAALVRWAAKNRVPLVPRAAGTGMPGGNIGSGVVVDLMRGFRRVGEVDAGARRVRVEPGATLGELNAACESFGLHFPVDPSSGRRCSLGGMLANNSAGAHSVKYGATREWVRALEVVLADGSRASLERGRAPEHPRLREILERIDRELRPQRGAVEAAWPRVRKNSSGYALRGYSRSGDAVDLLVGSEGTLALIVGATLELAPLPVARGLALLEFASLEAAGEAILALLPLRPATCEMLDRTFLELVRSAGADEAYPLRPGLEAILLVEVEEETEGGVAEALRAVERAVHGRADAAALAAGPEERHRLWEVRHAASPIIAAQAGGRVSMQFIEDGVVPVERLPEYVVLLRTVLERHDLPAVIFGHAGDGNLHVNPLVDVAAPGWRRSLEEVLNEVAAGVARLGGTLAGEHGDGRLRAPLLETVWGAEMVRRFRRVKEAFDPLGILNPGVVLPLPGQRPFDALRR